MDKKKLCLVIPSLQAGGMERVMSELAIYFSRKRELEIHLVLYGISREVFYTIPESLIIHTPEFDFSNNRRFLSTVKTLFYLRKTIKKLKPDSILSFGEYWNNFLLLAILFLKYPAYVSDRCQPDKSLGRMHDRLRKWLYPKAAGVILQTEKAREIYKRNVGLDNISVIPNPIIDFSAMNLNQKRNKEILTVGRMIATKHQDKLIEMFARVQKQDWKLVIVGYDHLKQRNMDRLKELVTNLGVADKVEFKGKQNNIEKIYARSSIFAFTSSSEGFPNVIGEAMGAGLAVIAFDCVAGPSDLISDNENGFLVPLFDFPQYEEKLRLLMDDEELRSRFGKKASVGIKAFASDHIGEQYFDLLLDQK